MRRAFVASFAFVGMGCLVPQGLPAPPASTVLQFTQDPAQYRSALPRDVAGAPAPIEAARGQACRTMLSWPLNPPTPFLGSVTAANLLPWSSFNVTWGNEGYARATAEALRRSGGTGTLFDVRADLHTTAVLGIFRRECVEVHALVAR